MPYSKTSSLSAVCACAVAANSTRPRATRNVFIQWLSHLRAPEQSWASAASDRRQDDVEFLLAELLAADPHFERPDPRNKIRAAIEAPCIEAVPAQGDELGIFVFGEGDRAAIGKNARGRI